MSGRCGASVRHNVCMCCTSRIFLHGAREGVASREIRCPQCRAPSDRPALCQPNICVPASKCRNSQPQRAMPWLLLHLACLPLYPIHVCLTCAIVVHACPAYPQERNYEMGSRLDRVLLMSQVTEQPIAGWMWCETCWRAYFVDEFTPGYRSCLGCTEALR